MKFKFEILSILICQAGVKSEHKDNNGLTVIDHCVAKRKISNFNLNSSFMFVSSFNFLSVSQDAIRVILNYNTKLSQLCSRALVNASIKGYFDIVLLLLNFGVNPNKIDKITGTGPQHEAVRYNDNNEQSRENRLKIVQYLAMYGADLEMQNTHGETPMKLALLKPSQIVDHYINALKGSQSIT
jgi:hypothetical protein